MVKHDTPNGHYEFKNADVLVDAWRRHIQKHDIQLGDEHILEVYAGMTRGFLAAAGDSMAHDCNCDSCVVFRELVRLSLDDPLVAVSATHTLFVAYTQTFMTKQLQQLDAQGANDAN